MNASNGSEPPNRKVLTQVTVLLNSDGSLGFALPMPIQSVGDRAFLVGILQSAVLAAAGLKLEGVGGSVLMPPGTPLPDFRRE